MGEVIRKKNTLLDRIGRYLAGVLETESSGYQPYTPSDPVTLARTLQPGDILLVEGNQKVSSVIKYLTQSTWSHAALFVGDALAAGASAPEASVQPSEDGLHLIEVNLGEGCIAVPISKYKSYNTRICRPAGLTPKDRAAVIDFMIGRLGTRYDMKHIYDLLRFFLPAPPVPVRWRRRMIALGSGDPTRAICSSLIGQAYQAIRYPILPEIAKLPGHSTAASEYSRREILHIHDHTLFAPRDFDLSPYFIIVKPTLEYGFDYKTLEWDETVAQSP